MGQILVVNGADTERVRRVFAAALALYEKQSGLKPSSRISTEQIEAAKFPKLDAPTAGIVRHPSNGRWICGAGTYFYNGKTAPVCLEELLGRMWTTSQGVDSRPFAETDGMFVLAAGSDADLYVVTDRLGSLHAYWTVVDSCAVIATSSMVLASLAQPRWNMTGCREFMGTGTVFEDRTLFEGIEKLEPATVFHFHRGELKARVLHTDMAEAMYDRASVRGDVPQLAAALGDAVATISRNFARPACDLTGGFDSRAILGAALRAGCEMQTVVNGPADLPDVVASKRIAEKMSLRHMHQAPRIKTAAELWEAAKAALPLCDGEYELLLYAGVYDVHRRLAQAFDVTVNGSNGEICKGYWWELLFPFTGWKGHFDEQMVARKRFAYEPVPELLACRFDEDLADHFAGVIRRANRRVAGHPNTAQMDNVYLTLRMQRWQGRIASATSRIWPCASPFTFRAPMAAALSAPPGARVRNRMARRLIEYLNPALAALPLAEGYPALPLRWNTAHLFWPLAEEILRKVGAKLARPFGYYKSPVATPALQAKVWELGEVRELLDARTMLTRDMFRANAIQTAKDGGGSTNHRILGRLLTLELLAKRIQEARNS